ncbi:hypothetical protein ACVWXO_001820 [Bradyrhizobium sp. LM2.7]
MDGKCANSATLLGVDEDVRTLNGKCAAWSQKVWRELQTEDGQRISHNIKLLRARFEPEILAKEEISRQVKVAKLAARARGDDAPFLSPLL